MALSGTHIACGYSGPVHDKNHNVALLSECMWSQTMASAGTTTNASPIESSVAGAPIFSIISTVDIYFAIGTAPDATNGPRRFLQANTPIDVFGKRAGGEFLAWVAA
jgi:hypothetical protein